MSRNRDRIETYGLWWHDRLWGTHTHTHTLLSLQFRAHFFNKIESFFLSASHKSQKTVKRSEWNFHKCAKTFFYWMSSLEGVQISLMYTQVREVTTFCQIGSISMIFYIQNHRKSFAHLAIFAQLYYQLERCSCAYQWYENVTFIYILSLLSLLPSL